MDFKDAQDFLHIADNAYRVGAYTESLEIVRRLAYFVIGENGLSAEERSALTDAVVKAIARFHDCPDECTWEDSCGLMDLFR